MKTIQGFVALFVLCAVTVQAQPGTWEYGFYGGINANMHNPKFAVPGIFSPASLGRSPGWLPDSARFRDGGTGTGFAIGGILNYRLDPMFTISGRLGYNGLGGSFTSNGRLDSGGVAANAINTQHKIEGSIHQIELSPMVQIHNVFDSLPLYFLAGLELGFNLSSAYTQTERFLSSSARSGFPEGGTVRTYENSVAIPASSARVAFALGVGYRFDLESVAIIPEVSYRIPFSGVSDNAIFDTWSIPQLRFGINVLFSSSGSGTSDRSSGSGQIKASLDDVGYYDRSGSFLSLRGIRVEDTRYAELYPLLPYVFFPTGAARPADSAQVGTSSGGRGAFTVEALPQDAIEINKNTLNIIGSRMKDKYPAATLTITGTGDGKSESKVGGLTMKRAEFARDYLVQNFGVQESRITLQQRATPEKASSQTVADGDAENRRVEFSSSEPELLAPIVIANENQRIANPDLVEFRPRIDTNVQIQNWTLTVTQGGRMLREYIGMGNPGPQRWLIRPNELSDSKLPIDFSYTVSDADGNKSDTSGTIPVEYLSNTSQKREQLSDKTISKFSLVLFDFNSAKLSPENLKVLDSWVVPAIQIGSKVNIYGYTDRIGDAAYNLKLSTDRASAVRDYLSSKIKDARYEVVGNGEKVPIFDNDQPIGRHLSRTVQIYVETQRK